MLSSSTCPDWQREPVFLSFPASRTLAGKRQGYGEVYCSLQQCQMLPAWAWQWSCPTAELWQNTSESEPFSSKSRSIRQHIKKLQLSSESLSPATSSLISYVVSSNSPVGAQLNLCGVRVADTEALPRRPGAQPDKEENRACLWQTVCLGQAICLEITDFNVSQNHISTPEESQSVWISMDWKFW